MYLSLLLFQILEERSLHGEFNLASKSKSKLSFPFLSKPKVLAPITPAFDLAAWRAGTAWSFPAFSDLFKTLYLSGSVSFKVRGTSFVRGFELHQLRGESRGEGAAFLLVPLGISVDISFLRASLYPNNIPRVLAVLLCRAGLGFDIALYEMFLCFSKILAGPWSFSSRSAPRQHWILLLAADFSA